MPVNNHIGALIIKHLQETITEDEQIILNEWIAADDNHRAMFDRFTNVEWLRQELKTFGESDQRIKDRVYAQLPEVQDALTVVPKRRSMRSASLAAAVVIGIGFISIWFWPKKTNKSNEGTPTQTQVATVIPAGGNKATLTLADGTVIDLDKAAKGTIAKEGKTVVSKREDGQLEYQGSRSPLTTDNSPAFNMLSTPRGGQYQLLLPDGSKVWLNAASSIRFPTAFAGNERKVEITGEAYFEVAKDAKKPFRVNFSSAGKQGTVEVLGTHFNINAYDDEDAMKTTLLEGSIRVSHPAIGNP
jgi:ferric-dicitrate binding protein FerR (iron transport regulator)